MTVPKSSLAKLMSDYKTGMVGSGTYPLYPGTIPPQPRTTPQPLVNSLVLDPQYLEALKRIATALEQIVEKMGEGFV